MNANFVEAFCFVNESNKRTDLVLQSVGSVFIITIIIIIVLETTNT